MNCVNRYIISFFVCYIIALQAIKSDINSRCPSPRKRQRQLQLAMEVVAICNSIIMR